MQGSREPSTATRDLLSRFIATAPDAMIIVDARGRIVIANPQAESLFGRAVGGLVGQPVEILIPERYHGAHEKHRGGYFDDPRLRPMGAGLDLYGRRADGTEFPVEISLSPIEADGATVVAAAIRDTSERVRIERALKVALAEKDTLLREVHHRVKNNLQVVSTLLALQSDSAPDARTRELFRESRMRVLSMALVHEKLHQSRQAGSVPLREYVGDLVEQLRVAYAAGPHAVDFRLHVDDATLGLDMAVNLGLLLNELVSNALKHAFPLGRGTLRVSVTREPRAMILLVEDDGVGAPRDLFESDTKTLGVQLVRTLVKQLHGELRLTTGHGTSVRVRVPEGKEAA